MAILAKLLNKKSLSAQEKEAIRAAIGVLSWTSLAESKIKAQKVRRAKDAK
jgi:hypothetical protein